MRPINNHWKGMLTTKNAIEVAAMFKKIFGRKRFTYTRVRPDLIKNSELEQIIDTRVDVHTGVKLDSRQNAVGSVYVHYEGEGGEVKSAMLTVVTTEYLCMYATQLTDIIGKFDYTHKNPYIMFDGDRCEIKYQTPCGDQIVDVFVLEIR